MRSDENIPIKLSKQKNDEAVTEQNSNTLFA